MAVAIPIGLVLLINFHSFGGFLLYFNHFSSMISFTMFTYHQVSQRQLLRTREKYDLLLIHNLSSQFRSGVLCEKRTFPKKSGTPSDASTECCSPGNSAAAISYLLLRSAINRPRATLTRFAGASATWMAERSPRDSPPRSEPPSKRQVVPLTLSRRGFSWMLCFPHCGFEGVGSVL